MRKYNRNLLVHIAGIVFGRGPALRDSGTGEPALGGAGGEGAGAGDSGAGDDGKGNGDGAGDGKPVIKGDLDPDRAARTIQAARDGETKAKADTKAAQEKVNAILKAAGLTPDGKTDPAEQLKTAREAAEAATSKARQTAVELAVYKSSGKAGADADAVLDSRAFLKEVSDLDPEAADFGDKVTAAIKAALKANPKLAAASGQGPARQGADHTGGSGNKPRSTSLDAALQRKLGG